MQNNEEQGKKERQLDNLTNLVENQTIEQQIENLHDNYEAAQRYIEANHHTMAPQDLQNLQAKQQHRKEQMENL